MAAESWTIQIALSPVNSGSLFTTKTGVSPRGDAVNNLNQRDC